MASSHYEDGKFHLLLPHTAAHGQHVCRLLSGMVCLSADLSASVTVDNVKATLAVLEAQVHDRNLKNDATIAENLDVLHHQKTQLEDSNSS